MKLNIACPSTGSQQLLEIDDEKKLRIFYDLRISQEVDATPLGDAFKGYILRITGGSDKDGFPMKQGVLVNGRVRLLLRGNTVGFRRASREGQRKRKSVRGCIVGRDMSVLNLIIAKKGEQEIPGLTDKIIPSKRGPKRANNIRKLFNLSKEDDVRNYVITKKRPNKKEGGREHTKMPKIQRLVTSQRLQRKRREFAIKKARWIKSSKEAADYAKLIKNRAEELKKKRALVNEKRRTNEKLRKMATIKRALLEKKKAKAAEARKRKETDAEYKKKREERAAAGKKVTLTPEIIEKIKKRRLRRRRAAWLEARKKLSAARLQALKKLHRERKERKFLVKACLNMPSDPKKRAALKKRRLEAEAKKAIRPTIFSKKGAVKFLGKNARPFGKKERLAKKAAVAKKAAAPEAKKQKK